MRVAPLNPPQSGPTRYPLWGFCVVEMFANWNTCSTAPVAQLCTAGLYAFQAYPTDAFTVLTVMPTHLQMCPLTLSQKPAGVGFVGAAAVTHLWAPVDGSSWMISLWK